MTIATLIHPYTAVGGANTTELGGTSLRHTVDLLNSLEQPLLFVMPEGDRHQLVKALRWCENPAEAILHVGRLGSSCAMTLAALRLWTPESDPVMLISLSSLRLKDKASLQLILKQGEPLAESGFFVSLTTSRPLPGQPAARYQVLAGDAYSDHIPDRIRSVLRFNRGLNPSSPEATQHYATGCYLAKASSVIAAMALHEPNALAACRRAMNAAPHEPASLSPHPSPSNPSGGLTCIRPDASALHRAKAGDIEHNLMPFVQPHVMLTTDGCWLAPDQPIPQIRRTGNLHSVGLPSVLQAVCSTP